MVEFGKFIGKGVIWGKESALSPDVQKEQDKAKQEVMDDFRNQYHIMKQDGHTPEAVWQKMHELLNKFTIEKLQKGQELTEGEIFDLADDLAENGLKSSWADLKIYSETGVTNIKKLMKSRDLKEIEGIDEKTPITFSNLPSWFRRAFGKSILSGSTSLAVAAILSGAMPVVGAGIAGMAGANFLIEKLRSASEHGLKKQEVEGIIKDIAASQESAKKLIEAKQNNPDDKIAINTSIEEMLNALHQRSTKSLEARQKLGSTKHKLKWGLASLASSLAGAAVGAGVYELISGGIRGATEKAMTEAAAKGEEFQIRQHAVKFVHDAWHWIIGQADIDKAHQTGDLLTGLTQSGQRIAAEAGFAHFETAKTAAAGIMNDEIRNIIAQRVITALKNSAIGLISGVVFGHTAESTFEYAGTPKEKKEIQEGTAKSLEKTGETFQEEKKKAEEEQAEAQKLEEQKKEAPTIGDWFDLSPTDVEENPIIHITEIDGDGNFVIERYGNTDESKPTEEDVKKTPEELQHWLIVGDKKAARIARKGEVLPTHKAFTELPGNKSFILAIQNALRENKHPKIKFNTNAGIGKAYFFERLDDQDLQKPIPTVLVSYVENGKTETETRSIKEFFSLIDKEKTKTKF